MYHKYAQTLPYRLPASQRMVQISNSCAYEAIYEAPNIESVRSAVQ